MKHEFFRAKNGDLLAIAITAGRDTEAQPVRFLTDPSLPQQLAVMHRKAGDEVKPHTHRKIKRHITQTTEVLLVVDGEILVSVYEGNGEKVGVMVLTDGDLILLIDGGHSLKVLEDSEIIEVKQGPYAGKDDKVSLMTKE